MPKWLANLAAMYATVVPLLGGVYWIGNTTGWRPEWHWEAERRAWYDKASFIKFRILDRREQSKPEDPRLIGIYCGLTQAIEVPPDSQIKCD